MPSLSSLQLRQVPLNRSSSRLPSEHLSLDAVCVIMVQAAFDSLCCRYNPNANACDSLKIISQLSSLYHTQNFVTDEATLRSIVQSFRLV